MGKDVKIGFLVGLGLLAVIVIFWTSRPGDDTAATDAEKFGNKLLVASEKEVGTTGEEDADHMEEDQTGEGLGDRGDATSDQTESLAGVTGTGTDDSRVMGTLGGAQVTERRTPPEAGHTAAKDESGVQGTPGRAEEPKPKRTHKVVKGDSLSSLARKYYKDERQWAKIHNANKQAVRSKDMLQIGQELVIPYLQPTAKTGPRLVVAVRKEFQIARASTGARKRHVVRRSDNLHKIAKKYYKDDRKWVKVFDANRNVLTSPHTLRPGQVLVIP